MKRNQLFAIWELKERGWSPRMIKQLMPEHDDERDNPHYKCAAPMKFYKKRRVYGYERGKRWKEMHQQYLAKQISYEKGKAKREETLRLKELKKQKILEANREEESKMLYTVGIHVPENLILGQVRKDAIDSYNERNWHRDQFAKKGDDKNFLNRITVNYIVHELAGTTEDCYFPTLGTEGHSIINDRIRSRILKLYPALDYDTDYQYLN